MSWKNRKVLVTGGLGFVGSNLCADLVHCGAKVSVVDNMLPGHGGNLFNIHDIADRTTVHFSDICSIHAMNHLVQGMDTIFHLAGQVNHVASMKDPLGDLQINTQGTLTLLEACRNNNRNARIVFSGTRGSYGRCKTLPVSEEQPLAPLGIYAVTNAAAEQLLRLYYESYGIESVVLRITNTFGPRHQMRHNQYGVANWFLRQSMDGAAITVMGDGSILRDYLFIDDLVAGLKAAATCHGVAGEVINLGTGLGTTFLELADAIVQETGQGSICKVPFSGERRALEPGHYVANVNKALSMLQWSAKTPLAEGLHKTSKFYQKNQEKYW